MSWKPWSMFVTEVILGKKLSVLYGLTIGLTFPIVILIAFIWEFTQILIFYFIYETACHKIKPLNRFKKYVTQKTKKQKIFIYFRKQGIWGVGMLALYPFPGGGILSSVLLASILNLNKKKVYLVVTIATVCSLLILGWLSTLILQEISHPLLDMIR